MIRLPDKIQKKENSHYFSIVMALRKSGHFKLVSKLPRKVFELGT